MDTSNPTSRPDVMDSLTHSQIAELELQVDEYDRAEFEEIAANYGWDADTVERVWNWFAVANNYPIASEFDEEDKKAAEAQQDS